MNQKEERQMKMDRVFIAIKGYVKAEIDYQLADEAEEAVEASEQELRESLEDLMGVPR